MAYEDYPSQSGARLTTGKRKALPASKFVFPKERAYPVDTENRARNALSRGSQNASSAQLAKIRSVVRARYPGIKQQAGARGDWDARDYPGSGAGGFHAGGSKGVGARAGWGRQAGAAGDEPSATDLYWQRYAPGRASERAYGPADYTASAPRPPLPKQGGARGHADAAQDRQMIGRMIEQHEERKPPRGHGQPPRDGTQYGARMAPLGRDHALAMASATHLHRMGHINRAQMQGIHAHAKNALAATRAMGAPPPGMGPPPPGMGGPPPGMGPPAMGGGGPPGMSFGSLAPPDLR